MNRWISSIPRRLRKKQIVRTPSLTRSASSSAASERTERRVIDLGSITGGFHIPIRRPGARSAVGVDQPEGLADQPLGELDRVGDRRRGEDEPRARAVQPGDPAQPAQHVRDVGPEHAPVGVGLVDDHPPEAGEEVAPALVVGQDAHVEHVGVGEDQVRATPDLRAVVARGVAVVDRVAKLRQAERRQLPRLVLGERLGRVQVERAARDRRAPARRGPGG